MHAEPAKEVPLDIGVSESPQPTPGDVARDATCNIVLYQPEIPQNTGNIGRTCVAIGAKLWIVRPTGFRIDDRNLRRAGMDYWRHLAWEMVDDYSLLAPKLPAGRTFYITKFAERTIYDVAFRPGDFFVFGRESNGLPQSLREAHADQCLRIPMLEVARSLNLANSVAVVAYELVRQQAARNSP